MKGIFLFLLFLTIISQMASAQGNAHARQTLILHLNSVADMQVDKASDNTSSLQMISNNSLMLNVNSDNSSSSEGVSIKSADGQYVTVSSSPANLLSGKSAKTGKSLAINYLSKETTKSADNGSSVVVFTLTNR